MGKLRRILVKRLANKHPEWTHCQCHIVATYMIKKIRSR